MTIIRKIVIGVIVVIILYAALSAFGVWKLLDPEKLIEDEGWKDKRSNEISILRGTSALIAKADYIESRHSGEKRNYYHFQLLERSKTGLHTVINLKGYPPNPYLPWTSWTYVKE